MVGKLSNLSVWPVGAVSKTTTEKFIPFTNLQGRGGGEERKGGGGKEGAQRGRLWGVDPTDPPPHAHLITSA